MVEPATSVPSTKITIQRQKKVEWNCGIYVTGNIPALGDWDIKKAVRLEFSSGHSWSKEFEIDASVRLEYKCFVSFYQSPEESLVLWEDGPNTIVNPSQILSQESTPIPRPYIAENLPTTSETSNLFVSPSQILRQKNAPILRQPVRTPSIPSGVIMYAFKNKRNQFFVPSTNNKIADFTYPAVMFDTGCSTLLLPFPSSVSMGEFANTFEKPGSYKWEIGHTKGTGALSSPILRLQAYAQTNYFSVSIASLVPESGVDIKVPLLRFQLSLENVRALLQLCASRNNLLTQIDQNTLREFMTMADSVKLQFPGSRLGEQRSNVLIGQSVLQACSSFMVQTYDVQLIVDPQKFLWRTVNNMDLHFLQHIQATRIEVPEFDDFEDNDHQSDPGDLLADLERDF